MYMYISLLIGFSVIFYFIITATHTYRMSTKIQIDTYESTKQVPTPCVVVCRTVASVYDGMASVDAERTAASVHRRGQPSGLLPGLWDKVRSSLARRLRSRCANIAPLMFQYIACMAREPMKVSLTAETAPVSRL